MGDGDVDYDHHVADGGDDDGDGDGLDDEADDDGVNGDIFYGGAYG